MGTELGPATVKVTLNVEDAKRQIEELRKEIRKGAPSGSGGAAAPSHVFKMPRAGGSTVSGDLPDDPDLGNSQGTTSGRSPQANHAQALFQDMLRLMRIDRMRKFGQIHVQRDLEAASLQGRLRGYVSEKAGLTEEAAGTLGGVLRTAGALYAATSAFAKVAPYAIEAVSQSVPIPPEVQAGLNDLKNIVNNLESRVTNLVKATGAATELWTEGMRVTGEMPDYQYYWSMEYDVGVAEDDLRKKFDHFKRMDVSKVIGKELGAAVSKSFDR